MDDLLQCAVCLIEYDCESRKPSIGKCGHSICQICAVDENCKLCPICRKCDSFNSKNIIINYGLLGILEYNNSLKGKNEKKKEIENICHDCHIETNKLAICIDCCAKDEILLHQNNGSDYFTWNNEKQTTQECIQQAKSSAMCFECALSETHYGHKITTLSVQNKAIFLKKFENTLVNLSIFKKVINAIRINVNETCDEYDKAIDQIVNSSERVKLSCAPVEYGFNLIDIFMEKLNVANSSFLDSVDDLMVFGRDIKTNVNELKDFAVISTDDSKEILFSAVSGNEQDISLSLFNTHTNELEHITDLQTHQTDFGYVVYQKKVYIIGGKSYDIYQKCIGVYDYLNGTMKHLKNMHEARADAGVGVHDGRIIVCGGWNQHGFVNSVESYDLEKDEWTIIGKLNTHFTDVFVLSYGFDLYVIGQEDWSNEKYIQKFDESSNKFEKIDYSDQYCNYFTDVCVFKGKFLMAGDCETGSQCIPSFHPLIKEWEEEAQFARIKKNIKFYSTITGLYCFDGNLVEKYDEEKKNWVIVYE